MSVDSENKSSEGRTIASYSAENGTDGDVEGNPVTPEMVLRLPTITDSRFLGIYRYQYFIFVSSGTRRLSEITSVRNGISRISLLPRSQYL